MANRYAALRDKLPASYIEFIESDDGWEGDLGDEMGYVVIFKARSPRGWRCGRASLFAGHLEASLRQLRGYLPASPRTSRP